MRVTAEEHDVCRDELLGGSTASDSQVDGDMISGSGKGRTGGERWGWAHQAAGHLCGCKGEVAVIDTHVLVAGGQHRQRADLEGDVGELCYAQGGGRNALQVDALVLGPKREPGG